MRVSNLALVVLLTGCAGAKEKALRSALEQVWNEGDMAVVDEAYTEELAYEVKQFILENRALYPDMEVEIREVVIRGDTWVSVWQVTGTHKDLKLKVSLEGVSVRKREKGKFVEERMFFDMKSVYDQLGFQVIPPEGVSPFDTEAAATR